LLPWQLFPIGKAIVYDIAGLSPDSIRSFVERRLAAKSKSDQSDHVIRKLERNADLYRMAGNPFLLGLLIHIISMPNTLIEGMTRANVYGEIVNWIVAHGRDVMSVSERISGNDLKALEEIACTAASIRS